MKTKKGRLWIDYSGNSEGLEFQGREGGKDKDGYDLVEVTEQEIERYTKLKPIHFIGTQESGEYETELDNWSKDIKDGKLFTQVDMFGHERTVRKNELIDFISEHYQG